MLGPSIMGVLNVTPDSFSDGGDHITVDAAVARARQLVAEGASIVDIGGESTRPGAQPVSVADELRRVLPVVEAVAEFVEVSIDTRHEEVAHAAVRAGATIVNDVSASLGGVAADLGVGWVAMHMAGQPATMQDAPAYVDVVDEVLAYLVERAERARHVGVERIWIDPGFGFGKTPAHNLQLLAALDRFVGTGWPVLVGLSRKATMGVLAAASDRRVGIDGPERTPVDDRLETSLAAATWAMHQGVAVVRAHDVRPHVHAAAVVAGSIRPPVTSDAA